jgi:hypothetical protein
MKIRHQKRVGALGTASHNSSRSLLYRMVTPTKTTTERKRTDCSIEINPIGRESVGNSPPEPIVL